MSDGKGNRSEVKMADLRGVSWRVIAVAVILLTFCALCAPAQAGVNPDEGKYVGNNGVVIIGERNLIFLNESWNPALMVSEYTIHTGTIKSLWEGSSIIIPFAGSFDSSRHEDKLVEGNYGITGPNGDITVYFLSPELDVKVKTDDVEVTRVIHGEEITFEGSINLYYITALSWEYGLYYWIPPGPLPNYITYKLIDPNGLQRRRVNGVSLTDIDVSNNSINSLKINTADLDELGVYTLSILTDPHTNNGLDKEGPAVSFELVRVVKEEKPTYITLRAEPDKQTINEKVKITATTTPNTNITLNVTSGNALNVWFKDDRGDVAVGGHSASGKSDKNGVLAAAVYFNDTGTYEITAIEHKYNTTDKVTVHIVGFEAKVETDKSIYHIGEDVTIKGSTNGGTDVTIKVDDVKIATGVPLMGDAFSYVWDKTWDKPPGSYKIAIWVLPQSDPDRDLPDAWISIILIPGGLFAKPSANFVALGDNFKVKGIAPGMKRVDMLTIAPQGGSGKGFLAEKGGVADAPGLTYSTYGVDTDGEFETEKIAVGKDADTGTYLIAVLNYGRDRIWGTSQSDDLLVVISNNYATSLGVKTTDQLLAILKDKTINAAGTDDLLGIATIRVEQGFVTVDELEDVPLGGDITVTGTTNRQVDTAIIVTVESLDVNGTKLKPQIAKVTEDEKTFYNSFEVTFATESANIGTYQVTVDDGDGHTASATVRILPAEEHSVNVSTTPSPRTAVNESAPNEPVATPGPTAATTPVPSSPAPEGAAKEPGFEALPALIALAILGILLVRSRQKR
jgi:hypothetical protein